MTNSEKKIPKNVSTQPKKILTHLKAQRVVVDEIFDTGVARILRADRLPGFKDNDPSIQSWGDEKEDFIDAWKIEAFVGFTQGRKLREGDVFLIKDGSLLNNNYEKEKIIKRSVAQKKHLIKQVDDSTERARWEIKDETHKLTADNLATNNVEKKKLHKIIIAQKEVMRDLNKKIQGD